jgi:hypothetical protein
VGEFWHLSGLATLLYGLEPRDPIALVGAALVLSTVGAGAGVPRVTHRSDGGAEGELNPFQEMIVLALVVESQPDQFRSDEEPLTVA